jgi:hypothetical protein
VDTDVRNLDPQLVEWREFQDDTLESEDRMVYDAILGQYMVEDDA